MIKPLFDNLLFVLDLGSTSYKKKKKLREKITNNGGVISYILTKASDYVIIPEDKGNKVDTYKSRKAQALKIPVLSSDFLDACLDIGHIVDVDLYTVAGLTKNDQFKSGKIEVDGWNKTSKSQSKRLRTSHIKAPKQYLTGSDDCPRFSKLFHVAKFIFLQGSRNIKNVGVEVSVSVLELHIASHNSSSVVSSPPHQYSFRVYEQSCLLAHGAESAKHLLSHEYFFERCEDAVLAMQHMADEKKSKHKMVVVRHTLPVKLGSHKLIHMLEEMGIPSGILPAPVARLVFSITSLAFKELTQSLLVAVSAITPDQITKAVVLLMKMKESLNRGEPTSKLSQQFSSALSLKPDWGTVSDMKTLSRSQDFVQLLKDIMLVQEIAPDVESVVSSKADTHHVVALYKMLKCSITVVNANEEEHEMISRLLCVPSSDSLPPGMGIRNIYCVHRDIEDAQFTCSMSPAKLLFHASDPQNLVGILTRGLLLPFLLMSEHGGERSDAGMLGNAIYFADDIRKAIRYSKPNPVSGTRYLLVNEVALGRCHDYTKFTPSLTGPPVGYDSVRGVTSAAEEASDFDLNEYAIFNVEQQRMRYLVEFTLEEDVFVRFDHIVPMPIADVKTEKGNTDIGSPESEKIDLDELKKLKNLSDDVKSGLIVKHQDGEHQVPLEEVHIRAKMMDMVAEVVVMQAYSNNSESALEAKYVFPLDDAVAVCGFEAFINGKHVIGKVKEKEVAHKEYKAAIDAGHGAYLMDQEKPNIFTVSVGNLPPGAKVLIKITYVSELPVVPADDWSSDSILFFLPGCVAAAAKREALISGPITQTKVERVSASGATLKDTSLVVSVEMPFDIRTIDSPTHKVYIKKTATKACVRMAKKEVIGQTGFKLLVSLAEIHVPRMWVERHPVHEESQACMLAFYPEFDAEPVRDYKAIILLDMSLSMSGKSSDNAEKDVKKLALMILEKLPTECSVNVIKFGSGYEELFVLEQRVKDNIVRTQAEEFIQSCTASLGSSEAWRPLTSLDAVRKSSTYNSITNVFMLSDGDLSEENRLLQLARSLGEDSRTNVTRIFTFSVGSSANQHLLRTISYTSGAAHEHFSTDSKSKWEGKVENQLKKAEQPMLKDIRIKWKKYDDDGSCSDGDEENKLPVQAPEKIKCLFNACRLVVYGFIPHCTQAELFATVCGKEISTVVSTSQLSITTGKTLHRLAARAMIGDYEEGMHDVDPLMRDQLKQARKPYVIALSCEHDVVSPYTSFVAVEEREKGEKMASGDGPTVSELVDSAFVDVIPEIGWDQDALLEEMTDLERVRRGMEEAKVSYYTSVVECNRHLEEAQSIAASLSGAEQKEAQLMLAATKLDLHMDVQLPAIDLAFGEYLLKAMKEKHVLASLPAFVFETDLREWDSIHLSLRKFYEYGEKMLDAIAQKCEADEVDPRLQSILDWWNKIPMKERRTFAYASEITNTRGSRSTKSSQNDPSRFRDLLLYPNRLRRRVLNLDEPSSSSTQVYASSPLQMRSLPSAKHAQRLGMASRSVEQDSMKVEKEAADVVVESTQHSLRRGDSSAGEALLSADMEATGVPIAPLRKKRGSMRFLKKAIVKGKSSGIVQAEANALSFASLDTKLSSVPREEIRRVVATRSRAMRAPTGHVPDSGLFGSGGPSMSASASVEEKSSGRFSEDSLSADIAPAAGGFSFGSPTKTSSRQPAPASREEIPRNTATFSSATGSGDARNNFEWWLPHQTAAISFDRLGSASMQASTLAEGKSFGYFGSYSSENADQAEIVPGTGGFRFGSSLSGKGARPVVDSGSDVPSRPPAPLPQEKSSRDTVILVGDDGDDDLSKAASKVRGLRFNARSASSSRPPAPVPQDRSAPGKPKKKAEEDVDYLSKVDVPAVKMAVSRKCKKKAAAPLPSSADSARVTSSWAPPIARAGLSSTLFGASLVKDKQATAKPALLPGAKASSGDEDEVRSSSFQKLLGRMDDLYDSIVTRPANIADDGPPASLSSPQYAPASLSSPQYAPTSSGYEDVPVKPPGSAAAFDSSVNEDLYEEVTVQHDTRENLVEADDVYEDVDMLCRPKDVSGPRKVGDSRSGRSTWEESNDSSSNKSSDASSDESSDASSDESSDASSDESSDSSSERSGPPSSNDGFGYVFALFGKKHSDFLCEMCQEYIPDMKEDIWSFHTLHEAAKDYEVMSKVVTCFEEIVKSSGVLSLGQHMYEVVCAMIGVALVVAFCEARGNPPRICVSWLKEMDKQYPSLYSRLEFGSSWGDAAVNIVNRALSMCRDKSLRLEDLKWEVERYYECEVQPMVISWPRTNRR